jgi:hypothetical protein
MSPPRASSADSAAPSALTTPTAIAQAIETFLAEHPDAALLEDGKVAFDLRTAKLTVSSEHDRCTLHAWSEDTNLVRTVASATPRGDTLRLATVRFGHTQTKLLELIATRERRTPSNRENRRTRFLPLLERVLTRQFDGWTSEGFRTSMDLERSFGPSYARGMFARGNQVWAVIAVNADETQTIIDGILTAGILWLDHCRARGEGKRLVQGLRVVLPRGTAMLTQARMAWLNPQAAAWELYELDESSEELTERDPADTGNVRTRLIHHPDEAAARERFAAAIERVMQLVPADEAHRVDQHLRSPAELSFGLHGLEFAQARIRLSAQSFTPNVEITVGSPGVELTDANADELRAYIADLFERRRPALSAPRRLSRQPGIGQHREGAHTRLAPAARLAMRSSTDRDPLYRAAPERWLESVLRRDLAPLTRGLAATPAPSTPRSRPLDANDDDNFGNRIEDHPPAPRGFAAKDSSIIPRLDPRFVYAQVPAIAGASDRGMLDLLGLTTDGRLAVIELKASEDLHFALQGLDYWLRVRQHHLSAAGEFQRHGYFTGAELSPLSPRLFLVAPALRIHPATELVLRYLSPQVEWQLIALDERWRDQVRVVWRRSSKAIAPRG